MKVTVKYPRWHAELDRARVVEFHMDYEEDPVDALEQLFAGFGNHPDPEVESPVWREAKMRSMSVGDFVEIRGQWWQCAGCGWRKVTAERVEEVMALPAYETWKDVSLR